MRVLVKTQEQYNEYVKAGFNPLLDWFHFTIEINLRVNIQSILFKNDIAFYHWIWEHKPHICEETMQPLHNYSAVYVSHILSRGAHTEMRHDPRNANLLSFDQHQIWENGKRQRMRIFEINKIVINILKNEYNY
jgi:hypothetical protein